MEILNFHIFLYYRDAKKLTLENFKMECKADMSINKNNNKSNNKNQARITKVFEKFLLSETILSII